MDLAKKNGEQGIKAEKYCIFLPFRFADSKISSTFATEIKEVP
jgi:hypothetical protein